MKKAIAAILCIIFLGATLCSCSATSAKLTEENIRKTTDTAFAALIDFDTEKLQKYVDSSTLSVIMSYAESHTQFSDLGKAIFENLTYEIKAIDTEAKTVTVSVKNKDLYEPASAYTKELLSKYSTVQLLGNLSKDSWLDTNLKKLTDIISAADMQSGEQTITLSVSQGKGCLVLGFDEDAENAVSGGALKAIKSVISE